MNDFLTQVAADLDTFIDADGGFAETVTIDGASVSAVFDKSDVTALGIDGYRPVLTVKYADVTGVDEGDSVTVRGASYTVAIPPKDDGTGIAVIVLEEAS